jgi:hypothetical protein
MVEVIPNITASASLVETVVGDVSLYLTGQELVTDACFSFLFLFCFYSGSQILI